MTLTHQERPELSEHFPVELLADAATGRSRVLKNDFEFLGSPIGSASHCAGHTQERADDSQALLDALADLADPQVGLRLLRHCSGSCKLVYSIRTVPSLAHQEELARYDHKVRVAFNAITGLFLNEDQ